MQIELKQISFSYERAQILDNVSLSIGAGEFVGIIGPNGGGKTTLLKLLLGFLKPTRGRVLVKGTIGYVPQVQRVDREFPITVEELVMLGALSKATVFGGYPEEVAKRADVLLRQLGLFEHRMKTFGSLSGGMAQKALLARALLSDPDVLLLDEPTANIDQASTAVILDMLESLKGEKTILIVTHDLKTIVETVDRVLCVQNQVSVLLPEQICEHFALGLYHTPLLDLPKNHLREEQELVLH